MGCCPAPPPGGAWAMVAAPASRAVAEKVRILLYVRFAFIPMFPFLISRPRLISSSRLVDTRVEDGTTYGAAGPLFFHRPASGSSSIVGCGGGDTCCPNGHVHETAGAPSIDHFPPLFAARCRGRTLWARQEFFVEGAAIPLPANWSPRWPASCRQPRFCRWWALRSA